MIQKHLERVNKVFNQLAILPEVRKEILLNLVPVEDDKFDLAISLVSREAAKAFENLDFVLCWGIAHFEPDVALQLREVVIFNLATGLDSRTDFRLLAHAGRNKAPTSWTANAFDKADPGDQLILKRFRENAPPFLRGSSPLLVGGELVIKLEDRKLSRRAIALHEQILEAAQKALDLETVTLFLAGGKKLVLPVDSSTSAGEAETSMTELIQRQIELVKLAEPQSYFLALAGNAGDTVYIHREDEAFTVLDVATSHPLRLNRPREELIGTGVRGQNFTTEILDIKEHVLRKASQNGQTHSDTYIYNWLEASWKKRISAVPLTGTEQILLIVSDVHGWQREYWNARHEVTQ